MKKVILFFLVPLSVFAQSEFIENDDFGISGGYTYSKNEVSNSSVFDFVFTALGVADVGIQIGSGELENNYSSSPYNTNANLLYAAYSVKRRNNNLIVKILAGYYTGTVKPKYSSGVSSSGLLLGVGFYPRIINANQLSVRFALELSYGFLSTSEDGGYYSYDTEFDNSRSISLGINWIIDLTKNFHIVASPFVAKDLTLSENSVYYGVNGRIFINFTGEENIYEKRLK